MRISRRWIRFAALEDALSLGSNVIHNDENLLWQVFFCPEKGEWRRLRGTDYQNFGKIHRSFQSEIQRASRMGSEYYRTLQNGGRQAAAAAREQRRALAELHSQLTGNPRFGCRNDAVRLAGAFATGTPDFAGG